MMGQRKASILTISEWNIIKTRCLLCLKGFYLYRANGNMDRREVCVYHPGDLIFNNKDKVKTWNCCKNRASVVGYKTKTSHIWKSFKKNFASPQFDYVRTKPSEIQQENLI
ncbi:hypothetical protein M0804_006607 [Polistes exclamans]|nr:hypothetical protein M0804_006607 [Polistes exclamans]